MAHSLREETREGNSMGLILDTSSLLYHLAVARDSPPLLSALHLSESMVLGWKDRGGKEKMPFLLQAGLSYRSSLVLLFETS